MRRRKKRDAVVEASGDNPEGKVEASGDNVIEMPRPEKAEVEAKPKSYPKPGIAWGQVVTDSLKIDNPISAARRLREELELGELSTSYGSVLKALDKSARNLDDAGRLYRAAKLEEERFRLETAERFEVLRSTATDELMGEYRSKMRRSPTNDDIEDRLMSNWPDEYKTMKLRLAELHGAVQSLEILYKAWSSRSADLRIMAERVARATV